MCIMWKRVTVYNKNRQNAKIWQSCSSYSSSDHHLLPLLHSIMFMRSARDRGGGGRGITRVDKSSSSSSSFTLNGIYNNFLHRLIQHTKPHPGMLNIISSLPLHGVRSILCIFSKRPPKASKVHLQVCTRLSGHPARGDRACIHMRRRVRS
jgi:hypothetical protein